MGESRQLARTTGRKQPGMLDKALAAVGLERKTHSGVTFVGPNSGVLYRTDDFSGPDLESITGATAMVASAYCFTAIDYRMRKLSEAPLMVVQKTEGGEEHVPDHELAMVLEEPSPDFDMAELMKLTEAYTLITGAAMWLKVRDAADRVVALQPYSGDQVRTHTRDGRIYGRFEVHSAKGWEDYEPRDVVWIRETNPRSWRTNVSRLDVALSQLDLGHQVNRTIRNFMRKAMFPGGVVSPHPDWEPSEPEWNAFVNEVEAWHAGPGNSGAPLILQGGTTFNRAAMPLKDLLPAELLDRIEATVSSVFGVPPIVLGWKVGLENSPWSQMAEARRTVYDELLVPRWNEYQRKQTRQLLDPEERRSGLCLRFDLEDIAALREDDAARATVANLMINDWTRNERRSYTGQPPLPDDDPRGDEIGIAAASFSLPSFEEGEDDEQLSALAVFLGSGNVKAAAASYLGLDAKLVDRKVLEWALFDLNTKAAESAWEKATASLLESMQAKVLRLAAEHIREEKDADPDSIIAFITALAEYLRGEGDALIKRVVGPLVLSTSTAGVRRLSKQVGLSFTVLEPGLLTYAAEETAFLASVMGETTGRRVAKTVQQGLEAGETIRDLRKRLQESNSFSRTRAQLVARTETTRAWNGAQRRSLKEWEDGQPEGTASYKEWLDSQDARVRDEHAALGGEKRRIDEVFSNGLQEPGEPNCRCTLLYSVEQA